MMLDQGIDFFMSALSSFLHHDPCQMDIATSFSRFGLIFALMLIATCNTSGVSISCLYAIETYQELSGDAMTTLIIIRNTLSFAINYA